MHTIHRVINPDPARPYLNRHVGQIVKVVTQNNLAADPQDAPPVTVLCNWYPKVIGWAYMVPSLKMIGRVWKVVAGGIERKVVVPFDVQARWRYSSDLHAFFQMNVGNVHLSRMDGISRTDVDKWSWDDEDSFPNDQRSTFFITFTKGVLSIDTDHVTDINGRTIIHGLPKRILRLANNFAADMDTCQFMDLPQYGFIGAPKDKVSAEILRERYGFETFQFKVHAPVSPDPVDFQESRAKFREFWDMLGSVFGPNRWPAIEILLYGINSIAGLHGGDQIIEYHNLALPCFVGPRHCGKTLMFTLVQNMLGIDVNRSGSHLVFSKGTIPGVVSNILETSCMPAVICDHKGLDVRTTVHFVQTVFDKQSDFTLAHGVRPHDFPVAALSNYPNFIFKPKQPEVEEEALSRIKNVHFMEHEIPLHLTRPIVNFVRGNARSLLHMVLLSAKFVRSTAGSDARDECEQRLQACEEFQQGEQRHLPYVAAAMACFKGVLRVVGLCDSFEEFFLHQRRMRIINIGLANGTSFEDLGLPVPPAGGTLFFAKLFKLLEERDSVLQQHPGGASALTFTDAENLKVNGYSWSKHKYPGTTVPTKCLAIHCDLIRNHMDKKEVTEADDLFKHNGINAARFGALGTHRAYFIPERDLPAAVRDKLTSIKGSSNPKRQGIELSDDPDSKVPRTTALGNSQPTVSTPVYDTDI